MSLATRRPSTLWLLLPPLFLGLTLPATVTLEGRVVIRGGAGPAEGAQVGLAVAGVTAVAGADGAFSVGPVDLGSPDTLVISHPDIVVVRIPIGVLEAGVWHLDVEIARQPSRLEVERIGGTPR